MVYGCGIDIEEVDRFNKHYFDKGKLSDLIYDLFTKKEIENFSFFGKEAFLKGFCFKEAFYKAIGNNNIGYKDIEVIFSERDKFKIIKSETVKKIFSDYHITQIKGDVSCNDKYAIFKILLIKEE